MNSGANQIIMLLQQVLFVLFYTTTLLQCLYGFSSLANNIDQHFVENNYSTNATLNQHSAYAIMDLTGSISTGTYNVKLKLGQDAREYYFIIDTGSTFTWVNCENQSTYHYPHPPYNASGHTPVLCGDHVCHLVPRAPGHPCNRPTDKCFYKTVYADQSFSAGAMISDSLAVPFVNVDPHLNHPLIKFGCGLRNFHPPDTTLGGGRIGFDGVIGLAKNSDLSIINQLQNKGITRPVFGHCMSRIRGGYFFIGGGKPLPPSITWARMVPVHNDVHYTPGLADVLFNGNHSIAKNLLMIFDSGSTNSYFKNDALQAVIQNIKMNLVGTPLREAPRISDYPICWRTTESIHSVDQVARFFKTITLLFGAGDKRFDLPPYNYLVRLPRPDNPRMGQVCLAIYDASPQGIGEMNLIGATFFQDKLVVYDLERKQIGWARSDCLHRVTNDREHDNVTDGGYLRKGRPIHHFSSNIRKQLQPPPAPRYKTSDYELMSEDTVLD